MAYNRSFFRKFLWSGVRFRSHISYISCEGEKSENTQGVGAMTVKELPAKLSLSFEELERAAFPQCAFSSADLRHAAYAVKSGEALPAKIETHLTDCDACQTEWNILWDSDPLLTGALDDSLRVVIEAAKDEAGARRVEAAGLKSLHEVAAAAKPAAAAASAFVRNLMSSK
jgi:hypothetical protein